MELLFLGVIFSVSSQFENDDNLAYGAYFLIHDSQSSTTFMSTFDWTKSLAFNQLMIRY